MDGDARQDRTSRTEALTLSIGEVAAGTGLTERALRLYEEEGLIAPARAANGRRVYSAEDLEALARIRLFKKAGFTIARIKSLIAGGGDVSALIDTQLESLQIDAAQIKTSISLLKSLRKRLEDGADANADFLCEIIRASEPAVEEEQWRKIYERYYTPEEQRQWAEIMQGACEKIDPEAYNAAWAALGTRIKGALPLDPASAKAQAFLDEWTRLVEQIAAHLPADMIKSTGDFWRNIDDWSEEIDQPITPSVVKLITAAKAARAKNNSS